MLAARSPGGCNHNYHLISVPSGNLCVYLEPIGWTRRDYLTHSLRFYQYSSLFCPSLVSSALHIATKSSLNGLKPPTLSLAVRSSRSSGLGLSFFMAQNASTIITGFGVEIELTLAFHEDLLVKVLQQQHLARDHIVKDIPTRVKRAIGLRNHAEHRLYLDTRPGHRGWALRVDEADSSKDWQGIGRANVIGNYRTYWTEPLHIVQNILRSSKNYSIDVQASTTNDARGSLSYHEWKVCNDFTLVPADAKDENETAKVDTRQEEEEKNKEPHPNDEEKLEEDEENVVEDIGEQPTADEDEVDYDGIEEKRETRMTPNTTKR
ncbi:hypothetical protein EPUS_02334 [Endocarpon pusillum Z07020]|uniref:Uncharacterized protein n=1 Tax=Endocarpon pusillum (strain Z07020 / HMAS-L-300199) TaxID=1263415 RepID=U1G0R9_ENDPU|nr:uncharacterized protein EPUS_02334 [Endocarpon pusillum Z07020]ERF70812.1 hypothetical protein EPUS_02334 [Endocarpon pusillum Z07020]